MFIDQTHRKMIGDAVAVLDNDADKQQLGPLLLLLFHEAYPYLIEGLAENPVEHHIFVLRHALRIAKQEVLDQLKRSVTIALLHDIAPTGKIPTQEVEDLRKTKGDAAAEILDKRRRELREKHMRDGSTRAKELLENVNTASGTEVFSSEDVKIISDVIAIHDNPSNDILIPTSNHLAVIHREADRLWMVTHLGVETDLRRAGENPYDYKLLQKRLDDNIGNFKRERKKYDGAGYNPSDFVDCVTFFRTQEGHKIFTEWCNFWERIKGFKTP